jgi:hypothetical protein
MIVTTINQDWWKSLARYTMAFVSFICSTGFVSSRTGEKMSVFKQCLHELCTSSFNKNMSSYLSAKLGSRYPTVNLQAQSLVKGTVSRNREPNRSGRIFRIFKVTI